MLQGKFKVYPKKIISDIDPLVFGNFIEFTNDCINQGMWAELLLNRGFEDEKEGEHTGRFWNRTGYNDSGLYALDVDTAFGHGISHRIQNIHHFGGYKGIEQKELILQEGTSYCLSLWGKGKPCGNISIRLKNGKGVSLWQTEIEVTEEWKKYQIVQIKTKAEENASLEILLEREGTVWLDQCSLMPENAIGGIWKNVFYAAEKLNPTALRFPGGCFADCYYWKDGIGDRDYRPARYNQHWGGMEENNFGTDEFIELCRNLKCEPMICINFGSADKKEAAEWVEYCNGDCSTPMGKKRAKNGHKEPYHVKYWGIGNETWAAWEIGNMTAEQCADKYLHFAQAMRAVSPEEIKLIICGGDGNCISQEWNEQVLQKAGKEAQYIDLHFYAPQLYETNASMIQIYEATVYAAHKYEKILKDTEAVIKKIGTDTHIMVGEYNAMYYNDSNREHTLETALLNGGFLNMFLRNSDNMRIGIFSDLVNGWQGGCIRSKKGNVYCTPSYYALMMYAQAGLIWSIDAQMECDTIDIEGVGHIAAMKNLSLVDCAAALDKEGNVCLFLINRHLKEKIKIDVEIEGYKAVLIKTLEGENAFSINTYENEAVYLKDKIPEHETEVIVEPHSISMVLLKDKEKVSC